ncbi:MAG TPA: hypothetical protein VE567_03180 [Sphingomonas sp.]|nr:hypothetical protein [Sphingomonas sp.]
MVRLSASFLALVGSFTLLGSAAIAQPGGQFYQVTLASQPEAARQIVRGMAFACSGGTCTGAEGTSRPAIVCASIARELGPVTAFRAGGEALDGAALAKCNEKANTAKIARR